MGTSLPAVNDQGQGSQAFAAGVVGPADGLFLRVFDEGVAIFGGQAQVGDQFGQAALQGV